MRLNRDSKIIKIAARHSDLARLQAYRVGQALMAKVPELKVQYAFRASLGDINLQDPLWKMPEKGVFTEDFVRDLKEGDADLVVHSWKDLPTHQRPDTEIVATLERADMRDVLLFRRDRETSFLSGERRTLRVLTSSPRRAYNLESFLKSHLPFQVDTVSFETVRGNIPTRLKKLLSQDVDAIIVAKAALDRLLVADEPEFVEVKTVIRSVLEQTRFMVLPLTINPTAAAQGALAIETAKDRPDLKQLLKLIDCAKTFECVEIERKILASYGGGCHQKIGVTVVDRPYGRMTFLRGFTDSGEVLDQVTLVNKNDVPADRVESSALFPRLGEEASFFDREPVSAHAHAALSREKFLWVAREYAWPKSFAPATDAIVWTAGLSTWRALAKKHIWVSGSAESLGETEAPQLEALLDCDRANSIDWLKLTHDSAVDTNPSAMRTCATYRLIPKLNAPDLKGRSHFYWMSGSSFDRALELYPEVRYAKHHSGPGATHVHLRKRLGADARIGIFLSVDAFRSAYSELRK